MIDNPVDATVFRLSSVSAPVEHGDIPTSLPGFWLPLRIFGPTEAWVA